MLQESKNRHFLTFCNALLFTDYNQRSAFEKQFKGMSAASFTYEDFEATRERLVKDVNSSLSEKDRSFLLSFKRGNPDWDLFPVPDLKKMQAIQWKLMNIQNLKSSNPERHIGSQFNSDWTNKLLICIDEVLFNKEELTKELNI